MTSITLTSTPNPSILLQTVTFGSSVTLPTPAPSNFTSHVLFVVDGLPLGLSPINFTTGSSSASTDFSLNILLIGQHKIFAVFIPYPENYNPLVSPTINQQVNLF